MKKFILLTLIIITILSCKKQYTYVEYSKEFGTIVEESSQIEADNDTMAYFAAYQKFCISLGSEAMIRKSNPNFSSIVSFSLYDRDGEKIVTPHPKNFIYQNWEDTEHSVFRMMATDNILYQKLRDYKNNTPEFQE